MITLNSNYDVLSDSVFRFKNDINVDDWILTIEKTALLSYPFETVARRPHLTMELPTLFNQKDDINAISLRSAFFEKLMPAVSLYMQHNNISNMFPKKNFITVSKLYPGMSMKAHRDNLNPNSNHFIAMMYINDNFNGGELNIIDADVKYKPSSGDIMIYKGNMSHEVLPSDSIRYSIGYGLTDTL